MANPELRGRLTLSDETKAALASMEEGVKRTTLASSEAFRSLDAQVKALGASIQGAGATGLDPAKFRAFGEQLAALGGGQANQFIGALDQVEQRIARAALSAAQGAPRITEYHGALSVLGDRANLVGGQVGGLGEKLAKLGEAGTQLASGGSISSLVSSIGGLASSIPVAGVALGGLLAGLGALGGLLEHLVNQEAQFAFSILAQNQVLGLNTDLLQTVDSMVEKLGGSQEGVTNGLRKLQVNLESGGATLRKYGLSLQDVGITSTDLNVAVPELSEYLASNATAADKTAVSTALLGKGQTALQLALSGGKEGLDAHTAALRRNGVLMDAQTLQAGALTKVMRDGMGEALKGLEVQLTGPLFSGFSQLFNLIEGGAQGAQGAFHGIGEALNSVMTAVTGFLSGLTGIQLDAPAEQLRKLQEAAVASAQATITQITPLRDAAQAAADQKSALDALKRSTQEQTQSIDTQVKSLQGRQQEFDKDIQAQIQGQRNLVTALDQRVQMQDLLQRQADDNHTSTLAKLKDQLAAVQTTYDGQRKAGESVADYQKRIKEQDLQAQIRAEEDKRAQQKDSTDILKAQLKAQTDAVVRELEARKTAYDGDTKARLDALNAQKSALQQHLADAQAAQTAANDQAKSDLADYNAQITRALDTIATGGKNVATQLPNDINQGMVDAGAAVRKTFQGWIDHPDTIIPDLEVLGIQLAMSITDGLVKYMTSVGGLKMAKAITDGILRATNVVPGLDFLTGVIGSGADKLLDDAIKRAEQGLTMPSPAQAGQGVGALVNLLGATSSPPSAANQTRQFGGGVLGGIDYVVGEKGPERFRAPADGHISPAGQPAPGGQTFVFNIQGAPQWSADELMREAAWHMKVA